ncbi:GNAT family N-acetyltransferase [Nocardioides sp.]|uniref:GNAT family N-acetyltransferase n=1 Tax=Nocardioides sp. TaxID=35761 RepID=UPI0035279F77
MTVAVATSTFAELDPRTAYELWRLRQQVFVVEQACPYPDLDGRDTEPETRHLLLHDDGALVGCLRLLDDGDALRIGRVVVAPEARGRGLAALLMEEALRAVGERRVRLDAQTGLAEWYAGFGFAATGPAFDEDGIMHLPMERPGG